MPQTMGNLPVGSKVKDLRSKHLGAVVPFVKVAHNHVGYPQDSSTLHAEKIVRFAAFDAREPSSPYHYQDPVNYTWRGHRIGGNNRYSVSNIAGFLNSTAASNWYFSQHQYDAPPIASNLGYGGSVGLNPYNTAPGFMHGLSAEFKDALLTTTMPIAYPVLPSHGGKDSFSLKIFLLNAIEVGGGFGKSEGKEDYNGAVLEWFDVDYTTLRKRLKRIPTAEAYYADENRPLALPLPTDGRDWFLRSPASEYFYATQYSGVISVNDDGTPGEVAGGGGGVRNAHDGTVGIAPACNIKNTTLVSDTPDADGYYILFPNNPPTTPGGISVPGSINVNGTVTGTWTPSTDPDGDAITYHCERAINGGAYQNIYSGANLSFSHAVTGAMGSLQYRVKAADAKGGESDYRYSAVVSVVNNSAPTISGQDANLGMLTSPPVVNFTVTDPDAGETVKIDINLDGVNVMHDDQVPLGQQISFFVPTLPFIQLGKGTHTLVIVATDSSGAAATRTFSFTRDVSHVDVQRYPILTDGRATYVQLDLLFAPEGAEVTVCNNAFDEVPTWETYTLGTRHDFANTVTTSGQWALSVRVKLNPAQDVPLAYVSQIKGTYSTGLGGISGSLSFIGLIQDQQTRIDEQQEQLEELQAQLDAQQALIEDINATLHAGAQQIS